MTIEELKRLVTELTQALRRRGDVTSRAYLPPQEVTSGAVVLIPPLCRQRITNIGDDDLVFLAICSPRFRPEAYEDVEG